MTAAIDPASPPMPQSTPMSFSGRGGEFFGLLVKGSLFMIPTFGFYRFWLITKLRRHLWANTQVAGETFEYTGTAKELLIGFLIALAVLTPLYLGYFILGILLEEAAALASLPLLVIMYLLTHFGVYRARKYRASRTAFRGIRFWMKGAGWAYAFRAILWDLATLLTLGLALPWAMASLERYRMRHTYFGSVQGDFAGTGWTLFKRGWWVWLLGWAIIAGSVVLAVAGASRDSEGPDLVAGLLTLGVFVAIAALGPPAMAIFTRWQIEGIRFGDVVVSSSLGIGSLYGLFFKWLFSSIGFMTAFAVIVAILVGIFAAAFQGALQNLDAQNFQGLTLATVSFFMGGALVYLLLLLGMGVLQRYFFGRGLWVLAVSSVTIGNLQVVDQVVAAGQASGSLGEGLADALDFNVGI
ncbi:MAG: YjgN family protein [Pseudomonadota bacterium]|nr:YjgN family protein [Pseudomonadota bacterium]